jgi:hypothetical protein
LEADTDNSPGGRNKSEKLRFKQSILQYICKLSKLIESLRSE